MIIKYKYYKMQLDPKIWGPKYWFVLHTIALTYPKLPNAVTKKKYYDFIQNIPLFLPIDNIGNVFASFLDKYPVTPYLHSREAFIKWMHFIHNKVNVYLDKPEISIEESMSLYYDNYKPKVVKNYQDKIKRKKIIYMVIILFIIFISVFLYVK